MSLSALKAFRRKPVYTISESPHTPKVAQPGHRHRHDVSASTDIVLLSDSDCPSSEKVQNLSRGGKRKGHIKTGCTDTGKCSTVKQRKQKPVERLYEQDLHSEIPAKSRKRTEQTKQNPMAIGVTVSDCPAAFGSKPGKEDDASKVVANDTDDSSWLEELGYCVGAKVVLSQLQSCPELNGKTGKLVKFLTDSMRWQVDIDGVGTRNLKMVNLVVQDHEDEDEWGDDWHWEDEGGEEEEKEVDECVDPCDEVEIAQQRIQDGTRRQTAAKTLVREAQARLKEVQDSSKQAAKQDDDISWIEELGYFRGGTAVLYGVDSSPELNGRTGKLVKFLTDSMSWEVDVDGVGMTTLKLANLVVQSPDDVSLTGRNR